MRRLLAAAIVLCATLPAQAATPFLWQPGAANTGLYAPALTLMSTELNAFASGAVVLSSVGGSAGVFGNSNTGQVIWSPLVLTLSSTGGAFQTGSNLSCWFLQSLDGVTFENGSAAPPRAPDVVFPLPAAALAATTTFLSQGSGAAAGIAFQGIVPE